MQLGKCSKSRNQKISESRTYLPSEKARTNEDPMRFFMDQLKLKNYQPGNKEVDLMI